MSFQSTIIQHDVIIGAANEAIASVPNGTTGQVLTANTGADPTWQSISTGSLTYTNVNHAASPYTVLAGDQYISVDVSGGVVTLLFPNAPTANRVWIIKDRTGNASLNHITITTVGGVVTIDGQTTYTIDSNFAAIQMLANATPTYEVY